MTPIAPRMNRIGTTPRSRVPHGAPTEPEASRWAGSTTRASWLASIVTSTSSGCPAGSGCSAVIVLNPNGGGSSPSTKLRSMPPLSEVMCHTGDPPGVRTSTSRTRSSSQRPMRMAMPLAAPRAGMTPMRSPGRVVVPRPNATAATNAMTTSTPIPPTSTITSDGASVGRLLTPLRVCAEPLDRLPERELGVDAGGAGVDDQAQQTVTEVIGRRVGLGLDADRARLAHHLVGVHERGQRRRDAVERRRAPLLLPLDLLPVADHVVRPADGDITEDVRVPRLELVGDPTGDVREREPALLRRDRGVEVHLEQEVAELLLEVVDG